LPLARVTEVPPGDASQSSVTVPVEDCPGLTELGLSPRFERAGVLAGESTVKAGRRFRESAPRVADKVVVPAH
jgi:hypothetical protein